MVSLNFSKDTCFPFTSYSTISLYGPSSNSPEMIEKGIPNNTKLHKNTTMYVKASAQSKMIEKLKEILSEEEIAIVKRARNADSNTIPKNSSVIEYKNATSLEGLLGYLFLTGKKDRLLYILDYVYNNFDTNEK